MTMATKSTRMMVKVTSKPSGINGNSKENMTSKMQREGSIVVRRAGDLGREGRGKGNEVAEFGKG